MKNRGFLIGAILVVAVACGWYAMKGKVPPTGTEGTIGAASRYQADQISGQDVQLTDPAIQSFLQSDMFHKVQTNPEFAKVIQSEAFRSAARSDAFRALLGDQALAGAVTSADFRQVLKAEGATAALSSGDWSALMAMPAFNDMLRSGQLADLMKSSGANFANAMAEAARALPPDQMKQTVTGDAARARTGEAAKAAAPTGDAAKVAASTGDASRQQTADALKSTTGDAAKSSMPGADAAKSRAPGADAAVTRVDLAKVIGSSADGLKIANSDAWKSVMSDKSKNVVVSSAEFVRFFGSATNAAFATNPDLAKLAATNPDALRLLGSDTFRNAASQVPDMAYILTDGSLLAVMQSPDGAAVFRDANFGRLIAAGGDAAKALLPE